jgi:hypothetical protein
MGVFELVLGRAEQQQRLQAAVVLKRIFSFPVMLGALLVAAIFVPLRNFYLDPDVWWHVKVGETILSSHHWPTTDPYSFTAQGTPWMAYEWLGEVVLAAAHRLAGLQGLMALDLLIAGAVLSALYAYVSLRSGNSKAAFVVCTVMLPLAYLSFTLRPQMLGYLFLILTMLALERFRQGRAGTLWFLPLLFLVWVNTHGTFIFGLGALGLYWVSGLIRLDRGNVQSRLWTAGERVRIALVFMLCLIAITITPYGTRLAAYPFDMAFAQPINVANIQEWQPMLFNLLFGKIFLALIILFVLAQVTLRPTWRPEELVLFFIGMGMACLHVRFVLLFVPFCAPMLAAVVAQGMSKYNPAKDQFALNAALLALVAAALVWFFPSQAKLQSALTEHSPVKAVEYLRRNPVHGLMYNTYGYGGYLIWSLDGQNKVFVDGRADIYERVGVLSDYLDISRLAPNTMLLLRAYNVQACLVDRDEGLATLLAASPEWQETYHDKLSRLFVRREGSSL